MTDTVIRQRFLRMGLITIMAVYFLIAIGGVVRASGAGMGCPDWPTCFGQWIPPLEESQLPANYQQIYAERGYADTRFNPVKTWTEYGNRLVGASIGVLILLTLVYSIPFLRRDKPVFWLSAVVFLLIGFQGWLGSQVVASNLKPAMITAHMVTAFLIVSLLIYTLTRSQRDTLRQLRLGVLPDRFNTVLGIAMAMTLLQIAMGTQIRESVDVIALDLGNANRDIWREHFPVIFYIHRSFSSVILLTNFWLVWMLIRHHGWHTLTGRFGIGLVSLLLCAVLSGITLDRLGFPAYIQPLHLLLANLIFGVQFSLRMMLGYVGGREQALRVSG
ncbi:MAG: hypothetical protein RLZZ226_1572 [Pseudomonadota bacterium]|jgi:cytochrome c oxidase assembly protein subunit 15